jgi:hypothetical protein
VTNAGSAIFVWCGSTAAAGPNRGLEPDTGQLVEHLAHLSSEHRVAITLRHIDGLAVSDRRLDRSQRSGDLFVAGACSRRAAGPYRGRPN